MDEDVRALVVRLRDSLDKAANAFEDAAYEASKAVTELTDMAGRYLDGLVDEVPPEKITKEDKYDYVLENTDEYYITRIWKKPEVKAWLLEESGQALLNSTYEATKARVENDDE